MESGALDRVRQFDHLSKVPEAQAKDVSSKFLNHAPAPLAKSHGPAYRVFHGREPSKRWANANTPPSRSRQILDSVGDLCSCFVQEGCAERWAAGRGVGRDKARAMKARVDKRHDDGVFSRSISGAHFLGCFRRARGRTFFRPSALVTH